VKVSEGQRNFPGDTGRILLKYRYGLFIGTLDFTCQGRNRQELELAMLVRRGTITQ
jgi:hypothetical protein